MDGNIQKALWLGVSIMMFAVVMMIGMSVFNDGKEMVANGADSMDSASIALSNAAYSMYDNKEVSGSDVISALNMYKQDSGDIQIIVTNSSGTETDYISSGDAEDGELTELALSAINTSIQEAQDKSETDIYINPYGEFYATLVYDDNDTIRGLNFEQQ